MGLKPKQGAPTKTVDYVVRTTGTGGSFDVHPPNTVLGQSVSLFAHLWKSAAGGHHNRMSLWIDEDLSGLPALLATAPDAHASGSSGAQTLLMANAAGAQAVVQAPTAIPSCRPGQSGPAPAAAMVQSGP